MTHRWRCIREPSALDMAAQAHGYAMTLVSFDVLAPPEWLMRRGSSLLDADAFRLVQARLCEEGYAYNHSLNAYIRQRPSGNTLTK